MHTALYKWTPLKTKFKISILTKLHLIGYLLLIWLRVVKLNSTFLSRITRKQNINYQCIVSIC